MQLSAPIFILKQQAKTLARRDKVRLHIALDRIAVREGFDAWSHLAARWQPQDSTAAVFAQLHAGDLLLVGARPGQGKTLLAAALAAEAMARGQQAAFFTLDFTAADVERCFGLLGHDIARWRARLLIDDSDQVCAQHIATRLQATPPRTLVVVDYLQVLDQRRENPPLMEQVRTLQGFAAERQAIVVCLSQIDRRYRPGASPYPGLADVRLPNPLDLSLFSKTCFLHGGRMELLVGGASA